MTDCKTLDTCLACGSSDLVLKLDLNPQALANNYLASPQDPETKYPLAVNMCRHCNHLQLTHAVDPSIIYKHYLYVSGTSKTAHEHFEWFAEFTQQYFQEPAQSVLDIGCNDGTQLDYYKKMGLKTYGIDPAENLYPTSSKNHTVVCGFFDDATADTFAQEHGAVDIIVAQNSFAHNPDPLGYLTSLKKIMSDTSLFFVQTSQADMVVNDEFDTIYHEHINFYNINSMKALCQRAGLFLVDVVKTPIHGTSYIFVLGKTDRQLSNVAEQLALETDKGLLKEETYDTWAQNVKTLVEDLVGSVNMYPRHGYRIIGYGAAAKGNTLLQFSGLPLEAIIDDNPLKQGLYSPGSHIPIVSIDYLDQFGADDKILFVPLAWNFYEEIRSRIKGKRNNNNDLFVKYFPKVWISND